MNTIKIKTNLRNSIAYDGENIIGRCVFVAHELSTYNNVDDCWGDESTDTAEWLADSLRKKYPNRVVEIIN